MERQSQHNLPELIKRCLASDDDAWHELIDRVSPLIFSVCQKLNLSRDESFDVFGQVCVRLIKSLGDLKSADRIFSYVASITRHQVLTYYQKTSRQSRLLDEGAELLTGEEEKTPEQLFDEIKRNETLMEALNALPSGEYKLIFALFLDPSEPTYKEIAQQLNIPISSIGPKRGRVLNKLYKALKRKKFDF